MVCYKTNTLKYYDLGVISLNTGFDESQPIFLQVADMVENEILNGTYHEGDQVISTSQFVRTYQINPATVVKGINLLVQEGILYKKRGIGMFVADGATEIIMRKRRERFKNELLLKLLDEAAKLKLSREELIEWIKRS